MASALCRMWCNDEGQDIAEYALMLAIILVLVIAVVEGIGTNASSIFSRAASVLQTS